MNRVVTQLLTSQNFIKDCQSITFEPLVSDEHANQITTLSALKTKAYQANLVFHGISIIF